MSTTYRPCCRCLFCGSCFFNAPATTEIYTLSLHDALPISAGRDRLELAVAVQLIAEKVAEAERSRAHALGHRGERVLVHLRSEEHTSELQSLTNLVCRLLLEKKNNK